MFITKARKFHKDDDGRYVAYDYYRLTKARLTPEGKKRNEHLLCLGTLDGMTKAERNELADMLTVMIEEGQSVMSFNPVLYEKAMEFYLKYRESRPAEESAPVLRAEAERREAERRRDLVTIRLSSLVQKQARTIGPEAVCRSTLCLLKVREFLSSRGWSREQADLALMQIIARAIYPFSELKTVRYLQGNSALPEMFKIERRKVTKDALYQSACGFGRCTARWRTSCANVYAACSTLRRRFSFWTSATPTSKAVWRTRSCASTDAARKNATTARSWCWPPW